MLGQYLSSLELLTAAEESELNAALIQEAANRGAEVCVFKPHPAAAGTQTLALAEATPTGPASSWSSTRSRSAPS